MNIGSLFRGLLGDSKPGEAKSLELKEGQVVRGVVLSVSDSGNEAVVQIQGTPVRAELETPLTPGQSMMLQVAPPGEGGLPVLKTVFLGEAALSSPQSMGEALEALGLTDSKAGKEIIQALQSAGLPLTKETAAKLDAIMSAKPQGVPVSEWLEAAAISEKRGLPVTAESVKGLHQAIFGPKLHELITRLEAELAVWAQQAGEDEASSAGSAKPAGSAAAETVAAPKGAAQPAETRQTASGTAVSVNDSTDSGDGAADDANALAAGKTIAGENSSGAAGNGKALSAAGNAVTTAQGHAEGEAAGIAANSGTAETAVNAAEGEADAAGSAVKGAVPEAAANASRAGATAKGAAADVTAGTANSGTAGDEADGSAASAARNPAAETAREAVAQPAASGTALLAKLQGVLSELRGTLAQPGGPAGADAAPANADAPPAAAGQDPARAAAAPRGDNPAAATQQPGQAPAPTQDDASWVGRVLKLLGAEHEQQAVRGAAKAAADLRTAAAKAAAGGHDAAQAQAALQRSIGGTDAADTLKGLLLQLQNASDVPPAVKDAAGQLIQQLTGQQLLLNTDRTAPFAQVTLFLPLHGPDGEETASVHIQSRRGRKGELDAANCRLWFDLDMKQLGQTVVDVQVVDRIVSLKLHNNDPWVLELLEERRDDAAAAVESIGYQLSSLRTGPLPELTTAESPAKQAARLTDYVPDSYKGVDYRV